MKKAASIMVLALLTAALLTACSDSTTDTAAVSGSATTTMASISARGGLGSVENGGSGAYFYVWTYEGNNVVINKSLSVDTTFDTTLADAVITTATANFGAVPFDVTTNTTVLSYASGTWPEAGVFFTRATYTDGGGSWTSDVNLYKSSGSGNSDEVVTGIHVRPGMTLTFAPNNDYCGGDPALTCGLHGVYIRTLTNDVLNEGTITVLDLTTGAAEVGAPATRLPDGTARDMADLDIQTNGNWLNTGTITLKGKDGSSTAGGNGGYLYAWARVFAINRGTVDTSGGNGIDGGHADYADIESGYGTWNSGPITAKGGTGTDGVGGNGSWIYLEASYDGSGSFGPVYNSATLNASGGNGTDGGGGVDNETGTSEGYYTGGDNVNSGTLMANGGDATTAGDGGSGGTIDLAAYGANIRNSGSLEIKGGKGVGAGSVGGSGGSLYAWTDHAYTPYYDDYIAAGGIYFSGNIMADAGSGETGGDAGNIEFSHSNYPATGDIVLAGYGDINLTGGKGKTNGGNSGYVEIYGDYGNQYAELTIYNDANFVLVGGEGLTTDGGSGGSFYADALYDYYGNAATMFTVENRGNITTTGGAGRTSGGTAGYIEMYSWLDLKNTGMLTAMGGAASDGTVGAGGSGESVYLWAEGSLINNGAINTSGAYGALSGGNGGYQTLYSDYNIVVNSGNLTSNGGNADATIGSGGYGANTGNNSYSWSGIELYSNGPFATKNTGTIEAKAGTGVNPGNAGDVYIDGVLQ